MPNGRTIHPSNQLEHYKLTVNDWPMKVGGTQCITIPDGYAFPLDIVDGLSYLPCRTYTDKEFKDLPHVIMPSDITREPSILDCTISQDDNWHYKHHASSSETILRMCESLGHFVGFAETVGHSLTYKILTSSELRNVLFRSKICAANDGEVITGRNLQAGHKSLKPPPLMTRAHPLPHRGVSERPIRHLGYRGNPR
jgi:hypothetical protein